MALPGPLDLSTLLPSFSLPPFPFSLLPPLPTIFPFSSSPSHSLTTSPTPLPSPSSSSSSPSSSNSPDFSDTDVSSPASTTLPPSAHMPGMGGTVPTATSLDPTTSSALPSLAAATSHGHGTGAIVGGVAGGIVLILVLFALALLLFSRRKKSASNVPDDIFVGSGAVPLESRMNDGRMHSPSHITPFYAQMNDADSAHSVLGKDDFEQSAIPPRSSMNDPYNFPMAPRAPSTVLTASEPRTSLIDAATALDIMSTTPMTAYQRQALIAILSAASTTSNPSTLMLPSPSDMGESAAPVSMNVSNSNSTTWSNGNTLVTSPYGGILPSRPSAPSDLNWNSLPSPPPYSK